MLNDFENEYYIKITLTNTQNSYKKKYLSHNNYKAI